MKVLIGIFAVAILSIIFTLQNLEIVETKALFWTFESPLALIIMISLIFGIVFGVLVSTYIYFVRKSANKKNEKGIT
jgi:uncharacterized integral membrane protein